MDHQNDLVHEWRVEARSQLLGNIFRLATFQVNGGIEVALHVERQGNECERRYGG